MTKQIGNYMSFLGVLCRARPPESPINRGIEGNGANETFFQENAEKALQNEKKVVNLQSKLSINMDIEQTLIHHGVKPTSVRLLVARAVMRRSETFSLQDVEEWLPDMDRSSIFRALRLFAEQKLLHTIDDGSGVNKYCVCRCEGQHHLNHIHFACTACGKTYCLEDTSIPVVDLPEGFLATEYEYIIKGVCPKCRG